jgi:sugar phosphate permease
MLTVIQKYTPENMRGKVFGLLNNAENIAISLPLAVAAVTLDASISWLGEVQGLQFVMVVCSAIILGLGLWSWSITRRALAKVL